MIAVRWLTVAVVAAACGGVAPPASRTDSPGSRTEADHGEPRQSSADPSRSVPRCTDGTCFACGDGICPVGFFCTETPEGTRACSWLPACVPKPSCACVEAQLGSGCSCEEREGGVFVGACAT